LFSEQELELLQMAPPPGSRPANAGVPPPDPRAPGAIRVTHKEEEENKESESKDFLFSSVFV
jgi:hypothetical protein